MSLRTVASQKQYGLIKKKETKPPLARPKLKVFEDSAFDEDDEAEAEQSTSHAKLTVNRQLHQNAQSKSLDLAAKVALDDDPSIFDYDGAYDSFKAQEVTSHPLSQPSADAPKSRYVGNLLSTAKLREKEKERIFERRQLKERKEEEKEVGEKEKFVTAAYKRKLMEDKKWEYEDKLADALEERTDVRKQGMEGFYKNLLTKNVALGGDVSNAVSVYTAGSVRQNALVGDTPNEQQRREEEANGGGSSRMVDMRKNDNVDTRSSPSDAVVDHQSTQQNLVSKHAEGGKTMHDKEEIVDKAAQVLSARERYLARKRAALEQSHNDEQPPHKRANT